MVCKDVDGSYISADSTDTLGEYEQESIPEEKVRAFRSDSIFSFFIYMCMLSLMMDHITYWLFLTKAHFTDAGHEVRGFLCNERQS